MKLADRLQAIWYGGAAVPLWLRLLVPVYCSLRALSLAPYRLGLRQAQRLPVPVIVVGNLTVGGSGKTPLVLALIDALRARGWRPGVISRGYAGSATVATRVTINSTPDEVGDEPCLIQRRSAVPVAVARRRADAGALLLDDNSLQLDVLIADDGLQHTALARDLEIAVIDGDRRFGNQRLLPAGPLREPLTRLATLDFRICNGGAAQAGEIPMRLLTRTVRGLLDPEQQRPLADFAQQRVHAIAGIGNPQRFFRQLQAAGVDVIEHPFPDHHHYVAADIHFDDELPVLMTEKDAVKCAAFASAQHQVVCVDAQLPDAFFDQVDALLRSAGSHSRQ